MRFRTKLFLTSSLVVLLLWGGTVWPIQSMIRSSFSRMADENFAGTRQSLRSAQAEQIDRLCQAGTMVMQIPELRALIAEHNFELAPENLESLQERIDNLAGLLNVQFVCVLDAHGSLIAQNSHSPWPALVDLKNYISQSSEARPLMHQLYAASQGTGDVQKGKYGLWVFRGQLYHVVGLPLVFSNFDEAPSQSDGALIVATPVTDALAANLSKSHNCEISFLAEGNVMASSLGSSSQAQLLQAAAGGNWPVSAPFDVALGSEKYRSYVEPLVDPNSNQTVGTMVIQSSLAEGRALQASISRSLLFIMAGGLAVAAFISFILSSAITRPVQQLVEGARRVASGDLESTLRVTRRDELGQLASAFNDMVMQLRARHELQRLVDASQAASKAKSQFLANMSHEIRTPLHGVIGMANLLLGTELNERQRHFAELVKSSTEVLTTLINDILDFSKIEAGKLELETIEFNLHAIVEDVVELLSQKAFNKGVDMLCDIAADVPETLRGDPNRLRQILMNLIGNAVKFTETGEIVVRIELRNNAEGWCTISFEIRDTGVGIPPERLDRLFKSFSQVDASTTRKYGGTGLGLAISKQLVELMGGAIGVKSEGGRGSTFQFNALFEQLDCPVAILPGEFARATALVIDTHPTACQITQRNLADLGLKVGAASTADEAIKLSPNNFSVVVVDQRVDRFKDVAKMNGARYVLLMTAGAALSARELKSAGFAASVVKPVRKSHLREAIARALGVQISKSDSTKTKTADPASAKPFRILVAEDNEVNQLVASEFLSSAGYQAQIVGDGKNALLALQKDQFDLVLMDCQMPVMDGLEATRAIREHEREKNQPRRVPIIALTANASGADRDRCREAGMDGYCGKPFKPKELLQMISEFLAGAVPVAAISAQAPTNTAPPFGIKGVLETCSGNPALAMKILDKFQQQFTEAIGEMEKCITAADGAQLARLSHALKGTAGIVAADSLRKNLAEMEQIGRANSLADAAACLATLRQEIDRCLAQVPRVKSELQEVKV